MVADRRSLLASELCRFDGRENLGAGAKAVEKMRGGKVKERLFHLTWKTLRVFALFTQLTAGEYK